MNPSLWLLAQEAAASETAATASAWMDRVPGPLRHTLTWAILLGAVGLWLLIPQGRRRGLVFGWLLSAISLGLFAAQVPPLANLVSGGVFWVIAGVTLLSAVATISARSPVYSAIWFAMTLLGSAGLFLFQGAQFLGVATIVVYAGAIVVTFLFVLMLAQPDGHETYDRISWGRLPTAASALAGVLIVGLLTTTLVGLSDSSSVTLHDQIAALVQEIAAPAAETEEQEQAEDETQAAAPRSVELRHVKATRSADGNPLLIVQLAPAADGSRLSEEQSNQLRREVVRLASRPAPSAVSPAKAEEPAEASGDDAAEEASADSQTDDEPTTGDEPVTDDENVDAAGNPDEPSAEETKPEPKSPSLIEVIRGFSTIKSDNGEPGEPLIDAERILSARQSSSAGQPQVTLELLETGAAGKLTSDQATQLKWEIAREALGRDAEEIELMIAYRTYEVELRYQDTRTDQHMAHLGRRLFSEHLVSVEVAGTLLLVALVGAVAIVIQGQGPRADAGGESDE